MEINESIDFLTEVNTPSIKEYEEKEEVSGKVNISQDLQAKGANESGKMSGNPIGLAMWLDRIYNQSISTVTGLNVQQDEKINELNIAITGLEGHNETLEKKIEDFEENLIPQKKEKIKDLEREKESEKNKKQEAINVLKVELEKIRGGDLNLIGSEVKTGDKIGFVIGLGILFCLTLYLVLFYTSVIFNAFILNVKNETIAATLRDEIFTATIVNLEAIPNTWQLHGIFGTSFLFLATAVFLALGYLIHKFSQEKKYGFMTMLYVFTFLFDALLAFEIVKKIHLAQYNSGTVEVPWEFSMFYSDVSFWIILFAGFLVYILWGVILSYSINESDKLQPAKMAMNVRGEKIRQLKEGQEEDHVRYKKMIADIKTEMEEVNADISNINSKIQSNSTAIDTKRKKVETTRNTIEIPHSEVIDKLRTFTVGWTNHVNSAFVGQEKEQLIQQCQQVIDKFITDFKPSKIINPESI